MNKPSKRAFLLSLRRAVQNYRQYGSPWDTMWDFTEQKRSHTARRLRLYPDVGIVDEGLWHKLIKGLPDMTAHPL